MDDQDMNQTAQSSDELTAELRSNSKKRKAIWENLFIKIEKMGMHSSQTYGMADLPDSAFGEINMNYSNKVNESNLTEHEKKLVDKIQNDLQSNLNKLILQREKSKILDDYEGYVDVHSQVKDEIRRLRKFVTSHDIESYIYLCVAQNKDIEHFIEKILQCDFETTLKSAMETHLDKAVSDIFNLQLLTHWSYLTRTLPEEDVIIYAVNALRRESH